MEASFFDMQTIPRDSPIFGEWYEVARIPCDGGAEFVPDHPIEEFILWRGGLRVTWHPFETYVDYHASYRIDDGDTMTILKFGGNYVPKDVDRVGRFEVEANTWTHPTKNTTTKYEALVLRDMWLGSSREADGDPAGCGHRFASREIGSEMRRAAEMLEHEREGTNTPNSAE